ncbi:MAG: indole-3-glycerol phosphate synthase TrpC [bacterium]
MIIDEILKHKELEIESVRARFPNLREAPQEPVRDFKRAISSKPGIRLIAEVKRTSPSRGIMRENFDPVEIARTYQRAGASAISVLTDEKFFGGHIDFLRQIRRATDIPLLRKDFVIHESQIYESRSAGADALLLIVRALDSRRLAEFLKICRYIELFALVEVHDSRELAIALEAGAEMIGINNRNLETFDVDLSTTFSLLPRIPRGKIVVSESGIHTPQDVRRLEKAGVDAILVGEALMRSPNMAKKIEELMGGMRSGQG